MGIMVDTTMECDKFQYWVSVYSDEELTNQVGGGMLLAFSGITSAGWGTATPEDIIACADAGMHELARSLADGITPGSFYVLRRRPLFDDGIGDFISV